MIGSFCLPLLLLVARPAVTSASDCPSGRDIENRLTVLLPERTALPGFAVVSSSADGLLIDLHPDNPAFAAQRSVVVGSSCEQRAEAAAVIIATWWPISSSTTSPAVGVTSEASQESVRRFAVAVGGYASIVSGSMAPGVRAEVALDRRASGFGVRLAVGGTFSHEDTLDQGRVSWSRAGLELGPTYSLRFVRFDAGVMGSLLWTRGSGFSEDRKESGLAAGFTLGVRAAIPWRLVQPWLELRGLAWPQTQRMFVDNSATGLRSNRTLPHAELQLGAGLAVPLF